MGRRSVPLALHIRDNSGGRSRLVQIGRPCAPLEWFDLIVTTPQYQLPAVANVLQIPLPFGANPGAPQADTAELAGLPRPHVAVLVGGPTKEVRFGLTEARELAAAAARLIENNGGTLLVTTSPRTPREVAELLRLRLPAASRLHVWKAGAANPYATYLATADGVLVTGDSISMLADACRTGAPVDVFPLPMTRLQRLGMDALTRCRKWRERGGVLNRLLRFALDSGAVVLPRAYDEVHRAVAERGLLGSLDGRLVTSDAERARRKAQIAAWEASAIERVKGLALASP